MPEHNTSTPASGLIAIMGGTFDPIHTGHLRMAIELIEQLSLAALYLVPLNQAVHREQPHADANTRLEMCRLAAEGHPRMHADDCEIRRGGPSWMVDTLEDFRHRFPDAGLCLVLGADAFAGLDGWRRAEDVSLLANIVVVDRPGSDPEWPKCLADAASCQPEQLPEKPAGQVCRLSLSQLEISSSDIRDRLHQGLSTYLLLPASIEGLIQQRGLYRSE